jgi:cysteinyl-tRNA synthetase
MALMIYNTATRRKEIFKPLREGQVRMYVCGPTVYDFLHVGNFRGPIVFNLIRNWLEKSGYQVTFVQNYTDVDDKIIARAKELGQSPSELTDRYISEYKKDFSSLGLHPHEHNPRVTEYMDEIIKMIQGLVEKGHAYLVDGEVFYSVESFSDYGELSHKNLEDLAVGIRVEIGSKKRNPLDFSLWKPAKPGEPKWPSPWGEGRPGWHIECSAMSHKLLGEEFDIHGGGIDLIFPHHENEIAQSSGFTGKKMVNYWVHWNFINISSEKMSKSLGNFLTARGFMEKYNAEILKYMILLAHYRSHSDFSPAQIRNAVHGLARVYSALALADNIMEKPVVAEKDKAFDEALAQATRRVGEALDDDFNTPEVFARIFEIVRIFNSGYKLGQKVTPVVRYRAEALNGWVTEQGKLMALYQENAGRFLRTLDDMLLEHNQLNRAEIDALVTERNAARAQKDFKKSDELRARLVSMGIAVSDTSEGTFWEVQK